MLGLRETSAASACPRVRLTSARLLLAWSQPVFTSTCLSCSCENNVSQVGRDLRQHFVSAAFSPPAAVSSSAGSVSPARPRRAGAAAAGRSVPDAPQRTAPTAAGRTGGRRDIRGQRGVLERKRCLRTGRIRGGGVGARSVTFSAYSEAICLISSDCRPTMCPTALAVSLP